MRRFNKIKTLMLFVTGSLLCCSAFASTEVAQTKSTKNCKPLINKNLELPKVTIQGLPERIYKHMTNAQELMAEGKYDDAIVIFEEMASKSSSEFIKASAYLNEAYAYAQKGDQKGSLPYFKKALQFGQGNLPHERVQQLRKNVAGLLYTIGDMKGAQKTMQEWMSYATEDDSDAYYLLAALFFNDSKADKAVCASYFSASTAKEPKLSYFQLLMAIHWQLNDVEGTASILKNMVEYFPEEKQLWRNLSQIYLQLDRVDESLSVMEMFYLMGGFETEQDYKTFSSLFAYSDIPYRAATILEEGVKKGMVKPDKKIWKNIAENYHVSNELDKAIAAYGKNAELNDTGDGYVKQADLLSDRERWGEAVTAYNKALQKGGLDDEGRAYLRKGVAIVNLGKCDTAIRVLQSASKFKKWNQQAEQWINYVNDQKQNNKCS